MTPNKEIAIVANELFSDSDLIYVSIPMSFRGGNALLPVESFPQKEETKRTNQFGAALPSH